VNPAAAVQIASAGRNLSAWAAIREFFALSPLWLKGATAVAAVMFFALAGLALLRMSEGPPADSSLAGEQKIEAEVKRRVEIALAGVKSDDKSTAKLPDEPKPRRLPNQIREQRSVPVVASQRMRKPLTRAERDQLAADLRLVSEEDDDSLQLLGDGINR
jgi:hypothetical protein